MKVHSFKIPKIDKQAILFQDDRNKKPYAKLHQHEEFQITLVEKGNGDMIVGETFTSFSTGDIFLLGAHVPHVFRANKKCDMVSVFFNDESLGADFFELKELKKIKHLLTASSQGVKIKNNRSAITTDILAIEKTSGPTKIINFLRLLYLMVEAKKTVLSTFSYTKQFNFNEGKRMANAFDFALKNYAEEIKLEDVAAKCMLSKNAFCKYFKQRTNKTFFQFLIEVRIEKACEILLSERDISLAELAHEVGFNNVSNFNRQFKKLKGAPPSDLRKSGRKEFA